MLRNEELDVQHSFSVTSFIIGPESYSFSLTDSFFVLVWRDIGHAEQIPQRQMNVSTRGPGGRSS